MVEASSAFLASTIGGEHGTPTEAIGVAAFTSEYGTAQMNEDASKTDEKNNDDAASNGSDVVRFIALTQPKLRAYIRSLVFNSSDVDDILQDVAVIAIEKADKYDPSRPLSGWVFGIAKNRILKYFEKQKRQKLCFSSELIDAITVAAEQESSKSDSLETLEDCLGKLDPDKRELLKRRHSEGTTARKLAKEIGYTDTRISRLINSLYKMLMNCINQKLTEA